MRCAQHVWAGGVDGRVDHERRCVEHAVGSAVDDFAVVVDLNQVRGFHQGESPAEGVDPEGCWVDRVTKGDMARHACPVSI